VHLTTHGAKHPQDLFRDKPRLLLRDVAAATGCHKPTMRVGLHLAAPNILHRRRQLSRPSAAGLLTDQDNDRCIGQPHCLQTRH
jgi:hypothetical protein